MNNIEIQHLKKDVLLFFGEKRAAMIDNMSHTQLTELKREINRLRQHDEYPSHKELRARRKKNKRTIKSENISFKKPLPATKTPLSSQKPHKEPIPKHQSKRELYKKIEDQKRIKKMWDIELSKKTGKPRILFVSDVKGWAWWIKSKYLKHYLSDEFDIDIINILGINPFRQINPTEYDIFFTFGYSYIGYFNYVPKKKKVTGVTAHRRKEAIVPMMKKAGWVHANSKLLKNELERWGFKNVFYLPNGVDENIFYPVTNIPIDENKITVGHVGKKSINKGQQEFIIPAIDQSHVNKFLHFNDYTNSIPHQEMPKIYQKFDVYICASYEDGTPNPALEAAACGRPIISNKIGNMPEFIKDGYNGFLVERNVSQYVEKIRYLSTHPEKMIKMGENARKTILEGWTWETQAENYRNMFREILNNQ
jgi:glycosyltransferase involved in cell wall biosynthesis